TLTYYWPSGGSEQKMPGIMLQDALRGLGVELKMVEMPWPSIVERVTKKETLPDVMTLINTPFAADPASGLLHQFYHSSRVGATYNWGWYVNPKVDQLLDEAERTLDDVKRLDLARQIQQIVIDDAAGIFIAYPKKWFIVSKGLKGVKYNLISMEWYPWYDMYIEK
ncbi:MAG: hypothetical protein QMD10_12010, partial [Desulfitobacteriaceae bacterium]|nr:hypothetical protein [Desulfitobacteriaceae bacterium]